jgi:membrane protein DedA with SNARE-associated domain
VSTLLLLAVALRIPHFHHLHGAPIDYAGLAAASAASWIGVPGPGEPVLVAAGIFSARHQLSLGAVLLVAWAAATAGGVGGWLVGLKAGRRLVTARGPFRAARLRALEQGEEVFTRYVVIAILLTPSWIAGIIGVRSAVYLPVNALGAAVWAGGIGVGSYFAGPPVLDLVDDIGTVAGILLAVAVVAGAAGELNRRRRRARRARGTAGP